jgi:hypothetical protein
MKVSSAILMIVLYCLCTCSPQAFAQSADGPGGQSQDDDAAKYWESFQKQRKLNQCLKLGRGECYKKYQEAVNWCQKNWNECLPMIKGTGVYAGAYGQQVAKQCIKELEEKCRRQTGQ